METHTHTRKKQNKHPELLVIHCCCSIGI